MRLLLTIFLLSSLSVATAQQATHFFPEAPGAIWTYNLTVTSGDTLNQTIPRVDVLTSVIDGNDGIRRLTVSSSLAGIQNIALESDTVRASLDVAISPSFILPTDSLLSTLLNIPSPQTTLFVTNAAVNERSSINTFRQRIATPEILRNAVESDAGLFSVTLDDSVDVVLKQSFIRLPEESIQLPQQSFEETFVFDSILSIDVEIGARTAITGRFTLTIPFLDDYIVTSWYAREAGLIKQRAAARSFSIDDRLLPVDINLDTIQIPAFELQLESFVPSPATSIYETTEFPASAELFPNYPNPFNPSTSIPFELNENTYVNLRIYDLSGRAVATLANGLYASGRYEINYEADRGLASGIFFIVLITQTSDGNLTRLQRPMLLLK